MAVKVVQGLVGNPKPEAQTKTPEIQTNTAVQEQALKASVSVVGASVASNEAVITSLRSQRSIAGSEKIRDHKQAKEVAQDVADRIREEPESLDAHQKLEPVSAREHFYS